MGIRLVTPHLSELVEEFDRRMVFVDFEGSVWRCQTQRFEESPAEVVVFGETEDSMSVVVPWRMADGSEVMVSTATLLHRESPYILTLELARGSLQRLLNEAAAWEHGGNELDAQVKHLISEATRVFGQAVTRQRIGDARSEEDSRRALDLSIRALRGVSREIIDGLVSNSGQADSESTPSPPLLACRLPEHEPDACESDSFRSAFDTAIVPLPWHRLEKELGVYNWDEIDRQLMWCQQNRFRTIVGPLMSLDPDVVPDWLYLWENDQERLVEYADLFVSQVVHRYGRRVNLWYASSGLNMVRNLGLTEESRLTIAARSIEIIRRADPQTPVMVGFQQPWGEYLARRDDDLSPIGFADALARSNLGISAFALELNFDIWPTGTVRRDAFTFLRKIDQWSQFQLPLVVFLSAPSAETKGTTASNGGTVTHRNPTEATQAEIVRDFLPLLKAHPAVQGIAWNCWQDRTTGHKTGLLDVNGKPKLSHGCW